MSDDPEGMIIDPGDASNQVRKRGAGEEEHKEPENRLDFLRLGLRPQLISVQHSQ